MQTEKNMILFFSCRVEKCNLLPDDCQNFAFILMNSKTLKILNLACNNLDKGIYPLCKALCHPNCILENLVLVTLGGAHWGELWKSFQPCLHLLKSARYLRKFLSE